MSWKSVNMIASLGMILLLVMYAGMGCAGAEKNPVVQESEQAQEALDPLNSPAAVKTPPAGSQKSGEGDTDSDTDHSGESSRGFGGIPLVKEPEQPIDMIGTVGKEKRKEDDNSTAIDR